MEGAGPKFPLQTSSSLVLRKVCCPKCLNSTAFFGTKSLLRIIATVFSFVWCTVVPSSQPPTYTTHILYNGFISQENFSRMAGISVFREKEIRGLPLR